MQHRGARRVVIPVPQADGTWVLAVIDKYRLHTIAVWSCTDNFWQRNLEEMGVLLKQKIRDIWWCLRELWGKQEQTNYGWETSTP